MQKYNLVNRKTLQELIKITTDAISQGYEPVGSVGFLDGFYIQAIVFKPSIIQKIKNKYKKTFQRQRDSSISENFKKLCEDPIEFYRLIKMAMPNHPMFKTEESK